MDNQTIASDNAKLKLLELIRERRATIFGAFSPTCTKEHKNKAWEKITTEAIALGLIPAHRDAKYLREIYWQNIRRRTIKKMDESKATGAAGGSHMVLDDVDNLVIDIIGRDSCVMTGLDVAESTGSSEVVSIPPQTPRQQSQSALQSTTNSSTENVEKSNCNISPTFNFANENSEKPTDIEVIEIPFESKADLQMQLLRYQIEYTRRDIYHRELAILEKERSLLLSDEDQLLLIKKSKATFDERSNFN